jgi:hypothetical protein
VTGFLMGLCKSIFSFSAWEFLLPNPISLASLRLLNQFLWNIWLEQVLQSTPVSFSADVVFEVESFHS